MYVFWFFLFLKFQTTDQDKKLFEKFYNVCKKKKGFSEDI